MESLDEDGDTVSLADVESEDVASSAYADVGFKTSLAKSIIGLKASEMMIRVRQIFIECEKRSAKVVLPARD